MSGQEGELSPSQEWMLAQVRWGREPYTGLNFSFCPRRARSFDLEKSDDMLRKQVKFRKQQDLHNILAWQPPEVVRLYNANGTCGHNNEGSPMRYHIIRGLDLKGLLLSISRQELLRAKSQSCGLSLRECASSGARLGKKVEKIIAVFDFEGLSQRHLWKPGVEFAQEFLTALEANYPEILRNIIVVRASKLFPVAFNLIKPYITEEMCRKVVIPGDDWKQELPESTSPDQLPVEFGGTMTDTDGNSKCLTKINYGGEVPRSYYLRNQVRVQYKHQVTVGRGSSLQVENEILFPGCVLRWQFTLDEVDIGFRVFLKTKMGERQRAGEMMEVLPSQC
ncbi:putative SEC14-like protein 6 [Phocoena sinus]|uniref:putative SEC14-like protein 6 n=1 Tax=Phocoena sinus TaxID=42100 RepID=UPI0013C4F5BB|nr:putative SEC14-like protein 6 [Phocoena sinus]